MSILIGAVIGAGVQILTPRLDTFLGVDPVVVFGLGIGVVEGPTLVAAIVLCRRVNRAWVRNALQAAAPFIGFSAYLFAYGLLRHPPFSFPFLGTGAGLLSLTSPAAGSFRATAAVQPTTVRRRAR